MDESEEVLVTNHHQKLLVEMHLLQQGESLCDVQLTVIDGAVCAHRLVLMSASKYFKNRLDTNVSLVDQSLHFEGISKEVLENVVFYLYTGKICVRKSIYGDVLKFCEELGLEDAVLALEKNIVKKYTKQASGSLSSVGAPNSVTFTNSDELTELPVESQVDKEGTFPNTYDQNVERLDEESESPKVSEKSSKNRRVKRQPAKRISKSAGIVYEDSDVKKPKTTRKEPNRKPDEAPVKLKRGRPRKLIIKVEKSIIGKKEKNIKKSKKIPKPKVKVKKEKKEIVESIGETEEVDDHVEDLSPESDNGDQSDQDDQDWAEDVELPVKLEDVAEPRLRGRRKYTQRKPRPTLPRRRRRVPSPCPFCGKVLSNERRKIFHQFSRHGVPYDESKVRMYPCEVEGCKHVASNKNNLNTHMRSRHGNDRPHICEFCGKGFKLPNVLATHRNIHTKNKIYKCEECDETFNQQAGLDVHIKRRHLGQASWDEMCHLCSEKFLQKSDLCWHLFKAHNQPLPDRYKVFKCEVCSYETKSKHHFQRHKNAHEGIKQFNCPVCNKSCSTKSELKRHVSFHGDRSYKCTFGTCTYACTDAIGLRKHIRLMHTHKDLKPYVCTLCPYKTGVKGNLDKHIRQVHNLEVVTKHTVALKMKYKDWEAGDIITKDGQLVHRATERKQLQRLREQEHSAMQGAADDMSQAAIEIQMQRAKLEMEAQMRVAPNTIKSSEVPQQEHNSDSESGANTNQNQSTEPPLLTQEPAKTYPPTTQWHYPITPAHAGSSLMPTQAQAQVPFNLVTTDSRGVPTTTSLQAAMDIFNMDTMSFVPVSGKFNEFHS